MKAAHLFGEKYFNIAHDSVEFWKNQYGCSIPANRQGVSAAEKDPCASAIACLAMMGLAQVVPNMEWVKEHALHQLLAIIESPYFSNGIFVGHCYHVPHNGEVCVESPCGIFFLLAALMVVDAQIDPLLF